MRAQILAFALVAIGSAVRGADFTFFTTSDVHYGLTGSDRGGDRDSVRAAMPAWLNAVPGAKFPDEAGTVAQPKGLLIPGDLVHWEDTLLWKQYDGDYAVGGAAKVHFPIYDGTGNHEVQDQKGIIAPLFMKRVAQRRARYGLTDQDSSGYHYSWDWEGVHFVNLNLCPGSAATANRWNGPAGSLEFLRKDLEAHVGLSGRPVFLMHHLPYNDTLYTPDFAEGWITGARASLLQTLKPYNVIGILHGHTHFYPSAYKYQGIDIFDDGANMAGDMLVIRIANGKLKVWNRSKDKWGTVRFEKDISLGDPVRLVPGRPGSPRFRFSVADQGIAFSAYAPISKVQVFDLCGRLRKEWGRPEPETLWDGRDGSGRSLPPGLYLARFSGPRGEYRTRLSLP